VRYRTPVCHLCAGQQNQRCDPSVIKIPRQLWVLNRWLRRMRHPWESDATKGKRPGRRV